jgi:diguanylate cyclase (GGDEF)-like protein/PAS domain S-box-containing protein
VTLLAAADALHDPVLRVSSDAHPRGLGEAPRAAIYAVFDEMPPANREPVFLGLVTARDISRFPNRIFADLLPHHLPVPARLDAPLEEILARMDAESLEAIPVLNAEKAFAGAISRTSLFSALLKREQGLLEESQRLQAVVEDDRRCLSTWLARSEELYTAATKLLGLLAAHAIERDLLQNGIDAVTKLLQARYGAVGILDDAGQLTHFFYTGIGPEDAERIGGLPQGRGLLGVVIRENQMLRLDDMTSDPRSAGFPPHHPPMKSLLAVPISYQDIVYGRVYLCDKTTGEPFTAHDELLASSFAGSLAMILTNTRSQAEREKADEAIRLIVQGTSSVVGEEFFRSLVKTMADAFHVRWAFVSELADERGDTLRLIAFWSGREHEAPFEYATKGTPCEQVIANQLCYYPRGIRELFPDDRWLVEQGVESYLAIPLVNTSGAVVGHLGVMHDGPMIGAPAADPLLKIFAARATAELERRWAVDALEHSERRTRAILASAADGIITIDERGNVESFNPAAERIFGYAAADVVGQNVKMLMPDPYRSEHDGYLRAYGESGHGLIIDVGPREVLGRRQDGTVFPMDLAISVMQVENHRVFIGIVRDISERKHDQERLNLLAHYDTLTSLPNRVLFNDRLKQTTIAAARHDRVVTVMFIDLDRFKTINDTLGHDVGDLVIKAAAERIVGCLRAGDTVARLGGDEYAVILADMAQTQDAARVAQKIVDAFSEPLRVAEHELFVTVSIGVTLYPSDDTSVDNLLKNADTSMYRAKERGRNTYQFYTADMNAKAGERLALETHLRHALERGELLLHYQPQVDLQTGRIIGVEALVRWQRQTGLVSPADFIPLAEETGLIVPIGEWVLRTACARGKAWHDAGFGFLRVSINVSARQFRQNDFSETVAKVLRETGFPPVSLELEMTESLLMEHAEAMITRFEELHAMGVSLSIDDFGTGYSSLSYLKRFPIDTVKIDRSFVNDIITDPDQAAIASGIISLAQNLRLKVVAEGVETEEQAAFLRSRRCDAMQGYLFSRPVSHHALSSLLSEGRRWAPIKPPV